MPFSAAPETRPAGARPGAAGPDTAGSRGNSQLLRDMAKSLLPHAYQTPDKTPGAASLASQALPASGVKAAQQADAAGKPAPELSGRQWASRFPTSKKVEDLAPAFRQNVTRFIHAIESAGGQVAISATRRPAQRAYLMHYAWDVAKGLIQPDKVPPYRGPGAPVNINWDHGSTAKSRQAAQAMVDAYRIIYRPATTSRHIDGTAIDMKISNYKGKTMRNGQGKSVRIDSDKDLHALGASFGVKKLVSDPPHWSADGR